MPHQKTSAMATSRKGTKRYCNSSRDTEGLLTNKPDSSDTINKNLSTLNGRIAL
uniref:Uncharacterized protein n=1 Tax=Anguilla anguilla TaxID=7936 RepID=A0A0E9TDT0_ANGAN